MRCKATLPEQEVISDISALKGSPPEYFSLLLLRKRP